MKKMKRNNVRRIASAALAAVLLLSLCTAALAANGEESDGALHIKTVDDLIAFSKDCTLDTWSQGKTVELDADLSLDGVDFTPIPSFGGTFHGNGHTISGFQLSGKLSTAGLFRTVQESGTVENLLVLGTLEMSGTCEAAGGIAGENYGKITGCSFSGSISGSVNTGGIAGLNGLGGSVQNSQASGAIYGNKMTGGIVGCNKGLISGCGNLSYVNTASSDETFSAEDISLDLSFDLSKMSKAETPNATTDTGGIAGYSSGVIRSCSNSAVIGYPHVGYNVGGIAGRSCGYIDRCENTGSIHGRKDVGGITGQMEPYIEMNLSEGKLAQMQRQLSELNALVSKAVNDAEGGAGSVSSRLNSMSGYVDSAVSEANDISVVIDADGSATASGGATGSTDITVTPPSAEISGEGVTVGGGGIAVTPGSIIAGGGEADSGEISADGTPGTVDIDSSASGGGQASGSAQIVATPDLGGLTAAINGIGSQLSQLNRAISGTTGQVAEDVRAINEKYNELTNTMFEAIFSVGESDGDLVTDTSGVNVDLITLGKASQTVNRGAVNGDLNIGGIAGSMAIEYELDPEDDVTSDLSSEYKQEYELKAVIQGCTNYGAVTAKRSYVGGITGKMDLGLITDSNGFGNVESENGSYVGGVAGLTGATVRSSFAKCTLSGKKYVGGIVGSGISEAMNQSVSTVSGCYNMVEIASAQQYFGAVSGAMSGEYLENYFVSDTLAGIDGQSYGGKAEPISYDTLLTVEGLPDEMKSLTLRFTDGEETLKEVSFHYGDSFDRSDYPEIPEKDDCYAYWDKTDLNALHFDTVVTAVYEPYVTTLAVEDSREGGKPVFYVEGDYDGTEQPTAVAQQKSSADFAPISSGLGTAIEHYLTGNAWYTWLTTPMSREVVEQWSLNIPADRHESHKVHYLAPDETADHLMVFVKQDGAWAKLDSEEFGSYLVFSLPEGESEIAVVSVLYIWWVWAILLVLLAALVICIVLLCCKHAKKRSALKLQATEAGEDAPALPPKKKKRWVLPLIISLLVLALAAGAALYFLTGFDSQITVYRALTSLEEQKELSASLTVDTEIGEESLHTQTELARKTVDGMQITRVELESVPLYYADEQVILENGRAYRLGKLFPDYSDLLGLIVPLYQDMEFAENEDTCQVSVKGETAQKVLQAIVPDIAAQLSETQELTVTVEREKDTVQRIDISASGVLRDDAGSNFSVSVCMDSVESSSDMEVPQAVIDTAKEGTDSDAPVITEDLLRLLSAWTKENKKDSVSADVTLLADCGPVVLRDSLKLYRQTTEEQSTYCISKGGVNLYWSDGTVVDENGQAVSGESAKSAQSAKLLEIAYLACQEGDFTKSEQDGAYVYSVRLDADAMSEVASIIAPDAEKLDSVFQTGTLTMNIRDGEMTGFTISCTGTVTVSLAKVSATVAAEFAMTNETVTIPKRVANSIGTE